jgi:hypothetical protein
LFDGVVPGVGLKHKSAGFKAVHISLGLHVIVGESVPDGGGFLLGQFEGLLVGLCRIDVGLLFLLDEPQ